jgi:adenylate cyclase
LAAAAGLAAALAGLLLGSSWMAAAVAAGVGAISFGGAAWALELGYLTASARPIFGAGLGFTCAWAGRLAFLDRRTKVLRNSFARYVAPEVVDRLLSQDRLPELEGERRHITVMFADLSGFTALSEQIDGKSLTTIVNRYLGLIATEVSASGGYVDKFIGDAVMAIWNAPLDLADHEHAAVSATIAIRDAIQAEAEKDRATGLPGFSIKIGLNTGDAVVGNVGSQERLNYTAVGDVVNVSARLEGLPGTFKTPILLGEASARPVTDSFNLLEIASIQVKGRLEPLAIFAPLSEADSASFYAYGQALANYRTRNFTDAAAQWRALAVAPWSGANLSRAMADFAEALINDEPDEDWSGAIIMMTK